MYVLVGYWSLKGTGEHRGTEEQWNSERRGTEEQTPLLMLIAFAGHYEFATSRTE